jgi:hypothetical protein
MKPDLSLDVQPAGKGTTATVTARGADGEVLECDKFDLTRKTARQAFIADLCDRTEGANPESLENQLTAAAAELATPTPPAVAADAIELGDSRVVRPERFILPTVSGLTVARQVLRDGKPTTEWQLMLRWSDGRREAVPLPESLLEKGEQVFLDPQPPSPSRDTHQGWSADGRKAWLAGEPTLEPAELCQLLVESFAEFLDLPEEKAAGILSLLTCWSFLSYVFQVFDAVPYISIGGPAGSGKTRVFDLLAQLVFRPLTTSNLTSPVLFRLLDAHGGVVLFDEAERLRDSRSPGVNDLLTSLHGGYQRNGQAHRCEKKGDEGFEVRCFQVFGPKAFASINEPPPTLASRCIRLPMLRSPKGSQKPRLRPERERDRWQMLRDAMHALAMEHGREWLSLPSRQDVVPEMSGRNFELWQPLLAIASWFEERGANGLLGVLQEHSLRCIESSSEATTPSEDEVLLTLLAKASRDMQRPTAGEILDAAKRIEPSLFEHWSAKRVGTLLRRYGFESKKTNGRSVFDPSLHHLLQVQERYEIDLGLEEPPAPEDRRRHPLHPPAPQVPSED